MNLKQNSGFLVCFRFVGKDGDISVRVKTVDDTGAGSDASTQTFVADGHATVGTDFQGSARAPDVRPPWATGDRTQGRAIFPTGFIGRGIRSAAQFAMDFLGVVMMAKFFQQIVGIWEGW